MISNIKIKNIATYNSEGASINDLKKVNFFYGNNGSGKTTLSKLVNQSDLLIEPFNHCEVNWDKEPLNTLVYNKDFVDNNFGENPNINGIFTLGKESTELGEKISITHKEIEKHKKLIETLEANLINEKGLLDDLNADFNEKCWSLKTKYDYDFKEVFKGFRKTKQMFSGKIIANSKQLDVDSISTTHNELTTKYKALFESSKQEVGLINNIPFKCNYTEFQEVLAKRIYGKEDVDIATLIAQLNITDWVKQGHQHMHKTGGVCPFCQEMLPTDLENKLDEYFDQTYLSQLKILKDTCNKYKLEHQKYLEEIKNVLTTDNNFLDKQEISRLNELIKSNNRNNFLKINEKIDFPSKEIIITNLDDAYESINSIIEKANLEITEHNNFISNQKAEKAKLIIEVWNFICIENIDEFNKYSQQAQLHNNKISGLQSNLSSKIRFKRNYEIELNELKSQIIGTAATIEAINKTLRGFNFKNFRLAQSEEISSGYRIVRENGEDAKKTLSEGEKTFITFLYFYHLIKGGIHQEDISSQKVVLIDDPISSLDSNILFIVSSLIRELIDELHKKNDSVSNNVRQLFILTHNIYFHKEITFNKAKKALSETFWVISKPNGQSSIKKYDKNPVKSSYELLWRELTLLENGNIITLQNVMRRILENYFKYFGNIDYEKEVLDKVEDEERLICRSLISWMHDGSHYMNDDLSVEISDDLRGRYLSIFEKIFIVMGHKGHYEMMMLSVTPKIKLDSTDKKEEVLS